MVESPVTEIKFKNIQNTSTGFIKSKGSSHLVLNFFLVLIYAI